MKDLYLLDYNDNQAHVDETINMISDVADSYDSTNPEITIKLNGTEKTCTYKTSFSASPSGTSHLTQA